MSSGWSGPGSGTAPQNQEENEAYARLKGQVQAHEKEKRDAENARRESMGLKPCKFSVLCMYSGFTFSDR